jgi:acyl-CoA thioesterase YciA
MTEHPPTPQPGPKGEVTIRTIAMPADTNPNGDIFGGWLMSQMDLGASSIAHRLAQGRVSTVAVDGMSFLKPVSVGDEVTIYASLLATGRTSIKVFVEAWRRTRHDQATSKVTHATFVFVAIDGNGRPRPLGITAPVATPDLPSTP